MKTIHHVIVTAIDAGMSVNDAEALAEALLADEKPMEALDAQIEQLENDLRYGSTRLAVLKDVRTKWGSQNGERVFNNGVDVRRMRIDEGRY